MDTKTLGIICLNSIVVIYIHFYKNEYKYYNVNIKSFNLSNLIWYNIYGDENEI